MALGEFELIGRYFACSGAQRLDTLIGVGDDAALLKVPADEELLTSWAKSVPSATCDGAQLAAELVHTCLGALPDRANPCWMVLSLTVPGADAPWLASFASRLDTLCRLHHIQLVGGDTTGGDSCVELHCLAVTGS